MSKSLTKLWGFLDFDNTQMHTEALTVPSVIKRFNDIYGDQIPAPLTEDIFAENFHGQGREVLCKGLSDYYNIGVDYAEYFDERDFHVMEMCRDAGVDMADGLIESLNNIKGDVTLSLTSNNNVQRCIAAMRYATNNRGEELVSLFGTRMFEAGEKQKPNPSIYENAVTQLQADKTRSFCVEDSHIGVIAGVKAGITVFGFTGFATDKATLKQKELDHGAVAVFDHWSQFSTLLKQHFQV